MESSLAQVFQCSRIVASNIVTAEGADDSTGDDSIMAVVFVTSPVASPTVASEPRPLPTSPVVERSGRGRKQSVAAGDHGAERSGARQCYDLSGQAVST